MWYVIDSEKDAELCLGFNRPVTKEEYLCHVANGTLADILARVPVKPDNAVFIPAGAIHAIGKGILMPKSSRLRTSPTAYSTGTGWTRTAKVAKPEHDGPADVINFASTNTTTSRTSPK